jgi:hypothetical protein
MYVHLYMYTCAYLYAYMHTYICSYMYIYIYRSNAHIYTSARIYSSEKKANILAGVRRARHGVAMLGGYVCVVQRVAVCCGMF